MVQNAGDNTFDYSTLCTAYENNEVVKELIANYNEDEVTLSSDPGKAGSSDVESKTTDQATNQFPPLSPEETVNNMGKRALKKRQH
jgi:hypothetical protein